jgi:hypothetical protein
VFLRLRCGKEGQTEIGGGVAHDAEDTAPADPVGLNRSNVKAAMAAPRASRKLYPTIAARACHGPPPPRLCGVTIMQGICAAGAALFAASLASAEPLQLPLECSASQRCVIQNYADMQPGAGAQDPACGPLTYDGHDGLDFRVSKARAAAGAPVLAPASGVVRALRDGEADGVYLASGRAALGGRDCGNGVTIEHADGWSSHLCHMRKGSVRVAVGERVQAGQAVGLVGLSGFTQFTHVHLTLRRAGAVVEPLSGMPLAQAKCLSPAAAPGAHWTAPARAMLTYRGAQWFASGFTNAPTAADPESWPAAVRTGGALAFWSLAIGPRAGDVLRLRLFGPDGAMIGEGQRVQDKDQAQAWLVVGKRTPPASGWPAGRYRGEAVLLRGGAEVARQEEVLAF